MSPSPKILAILPHVIPSTSIYVIKPLAALDQQGQVVADIALEYWVSRRQIERADVIVFCRNIEPRYKNLLALAHELGKSIIYDLDDDLFESLLGAGRGDSRPSLEQTNQLIEYLKSAHLVRVYSENLRRKVAQFNPSTVWVNGPMDWSVLLSKPFPRQSLDKVKIIYATSRVNDELINIFLEDVEQLLITRLDEVELYLWGAHSDRLASYSSVRFLKPITNYDRYFRKFANFGFDIGLAPLLDDDLHRSKTNIKFREYAASRIAGIYSAVKVYSDCVKHEQTGLLVPNEKGKWYEALSRLIDDVNLRARIQDQAFQYARQNFSQEKFCAIWLQQIQDVLASKNATQVAAPMSSHLPNQGGEDLARFTQAVKYFFRLIWRFGYNLKTRGARQTFVMVRWILNDLNILFWKR